MSYTKGQMVYQNDYKWTAKSDADNATVRHGKEAEELNRSEGYEMLYFINDLAKAWNWENIPLESYQSLEKIIKKLVPHDIRKHVLIKKWIEEHFAGIKSQVFQTSN